MLVLLSALYDLVPLGRAPGLPFPSLPTPAADGGWSRVARISARSSLEPWYIRTSVSGTFHMDMTGDLQELSGQTFRTPLPNC
jgi:hypothetical protein